MSRMIRVICAVVGFGLTLVMFGSSEGQQSYITKAGYIICVDKENVTKAYRLAGQGDDLAFKRFLNDNMCSMSKAGVKVFVIERSWGLVKLRPEGVYDGPWTLTEAIE